MKQELSRQRGRLVHLLELLDEKNFEKVLANMRLFERRRNYIPKNNGKGRPPLKFKEPSQEDEARREQYVAEIRLFDELLREFHSVEGALNWLQAAKEQATAPSTAEGATGQSVYRGRKIDKLLNQFAARTPPTKPPPAEGPRPWTEKEVREVLAIQRRLQAARVKAVHRLPIITLADQDVADAERARLDVLERFIGSSHLDTARLFVQRAGLIRDEVNNPSKNAFDPAHYVRCWRDGVDGLIDKLRLDFVMLP